MTDVIDQRRPLQVALVGCGRWGASIARAVDAMPQLALRWVCDPHVRRPGVAWAPALTAQVCSDVDAVIVATPPEHHVPAALAALKAGKPVLVEKPFAQSSAEVRQVMAVRAATPVLVGHLLAYHPGYTALLERVRSTPRVVQVEVVRHSPPRGANRCAWWTLAPHDLALLTRVFGEPDEVQVTAVSDGVLAQLSWPRARARLSYSTIAETKKRHWRVVDGGHTFVFDEIEGTLVTRGDTTEVLEFRDADPLRAELRHFAACVRDDVTPLTGIDEAERSVRLLCLGERQLGLVRRWSMQSRTLREAPGCP